MAGVLGLVAPAVTVTVWMIVFTAGQLSTGGREVLLAAAEVQVSVRVET